MHHVTYMHSGMEVFIQLSPNETIPSLCGRYEKISKICSCNKNSFRSYNVVSTRKTFHEISQLWAIQHKLQIPTKKFSIFPRGSITRKFPNSHQIAATFDVPIPRILVNIGAKTMNHDSDKTCIS